jgi:AsmA protein
MTDRKPPPAPKRPQSFESYRPQAERGGSPLRQLRPPGGQLQRPQSGQGYRPLPAARQPMPPRHDMDFDDEERSWLASLLIWGGLGIVGLIAAAAVALVVWSPASLVRDQLAARVKAKTGRDLVIAGRTSLSFYPSLAISMADVSLSAPPGMGGAPTIRMQALEAAVPLLPLLQKQVGIERLVMRRPVIDLRIDAQGRRSWDFADAAPPVPVRYAQAGGGRTGTGQLPKELQDFVRSANPDSVEAATSRGTVAALEALSLQDVRIEGGMVRFADERFGQLEAIQSVDASITLAGLASALDAKGSLAWRGEPIAFDARLTSPKLLSEERPARLVLKLDGRPLELSYDGAVTIGRAAEVEGRLALKSPSLQALLALLAVPSAAANGVGSASIIGRLKASETAVVLSDATLALDQFSARGTLGVEFRPVRPLLRGNLQIAELDLNRLSLPIAGAAAPRPVPAVAGSQLRPASPPAAQPAQTIEDLLKAEPTGKPGPRVQGFTQRTGWSDEVIDLSAFRLADADLKLAVGRLVYRDIKVGETHLRVALKDRALSATFDDIQLYDGRGRGLVTVDGAAAVPAIGANFSLDGTSALPLLKDAADFDWVAGKAKVNLALGGQGTSERQIVGTLNGKADVQISDGAIVGYNIPQILGGIGQGRFAGLERSASAKTDFSEMAASFTIQNGIATNKDLRLTSPMVRLTGAGSANLPERTMDYLLRPKVIGSATGAADATALEIPVKLSGSWDRPVIAPDLDAVLKNPERTVDTLKQLGNQFKNANPEAVNKAKGMLQQLLKR